MLKPAVEQLTVRSGDVELAVYVQGRQDGPTLVMVHGYPDDHTVWDEVIELLAADYRIVTYDTRGNGNSSMPPSTRDFSLTYLAEDLAEILDMVSPAKPVHLVAHDWGSIQTWESVCTKRLEGRIASFTSISGPCLDHAAFWIRDGLKRPTPASLFALGGQLLRSWYIVMFHLPLISPLMMRLMASHWPKILKLLEGIEVEARPNQVRDAVRGIRLYRANFIDRLFKPRQRIAHAPVQILVPMKDPFVNPKITDDLKQWVPRLWRRDLQLAHWIPLSEPTLCARYVQEFVDYIEQGEKGPMARTMEQHAVPG